MVGAIIWYVTTFACAALMFGIGAYAKRLEKPMWFWSGSTVKEREISDVPAYNRANGIMWISFSAILWISTVLGLLQLEGAGICLIAGCILGVPLLPIVYGRIYRRYCVEK